MPKQERKCCLHIRASSHSSVVDFLTCSHFDLGEEKMHLAHAWNPMLCYAENPLWTSEGMRGKWFITEWKNNGLVFIRIFLYRTNLVRARREIISLRVQYISLRYASSVGATSLPSCIELYFREQRKWINHVLFFSRAVCVDEIIAHRLISFLLRNV